ncbi:MAG TPA: DUF559 domain-containing protein [Micromonosporaceae bacterium]|nr:DUF559 domain-containing protein [Micromonosporaceae bacterium]
MGRVIRLSGATPEEIARSLSPLPEGAPAVLTLLARPAASPADVVAAVLGELEAIAVDLFPDWLPGGREISGPGGAGVAAVRSLALRAASTSQHFGPFLADLAVGALTGRPVTPGKFAPEVRAAGHARVIAASYGRAHTALLVHVPDDLPGLAEPAVTGGYEWLADRARIGIWLTGRSPAVTGGAPVPVAVDVTDLVRHRTPEPVTPTSAYPVVAGRPHPGSRAEQALEQALARCDWAVGRAWNQTHQTHRLANPVRVDLLWAAEKCVVEIDGPEHRAELRYAADRRRDVQLQLHGYAVLRFTNDQVRYDIDTVLSHIGQLVRGRRLGTMKGQRHAG